MHVDEASGSEEELQLALALLRAFPRALTPAPGSAEEAPAAAPVIDLSERRKARAAQAAEAVPRA